QFSKSIFLSASQGDFSILSCPLSFCKKFFLGSFRSAATIQYFIKSDSRSQYIYLLFLFDVPPLAKRQDVSYHV
ncbi:hypothetical protein, partial [Brevibacillus parabrevis]|uniref:hypothetical protein n=1 Tax=Brevibacillus parabrevis TaxID=54914 RepID=UPI002E1FD8AB|nr:hypothetical protein [Brevibacillus parabrevis]